MTTEWREFEKRIAAIEEALAPLGATVKTPDKIRDLVTGQLREVDATVRCTVGSVEVLITIEGRDRAGVQDVLWIEQLVTKGRDIGAARTIAVASSGFTEPAITKARFYGIETRTLSQLDAEAVAHWLRAQDVRVKTTTWDLAAIGVEYFDAPEGVELSPSTQSAIQDAGPLAPILCRRSDGRLFHIENILIEWAKRNGSFFPESVPTDGTRVERTLHQPFGRGCFTMETTHGKFDVRVLHIGLTFAASEVTVPVSRLMVYSNEGTPLVHTAEWELEQSIRLAFHRDLQSGVTHVRLAPESK